MEDAKETKAVAMLWRSCKVPEQNFSKAQQNHPALRPGGEEVRQGWDRDMERQRMLLEAVAKAPDKLDSWVERMDGAFWWLGWQEKRHRGWTSRILSSPLLSRAAFPSRPC